jgi:hypothetical protein
MQKPVHQIAGTPEGVPGIDQPLFVGINVNIILAVLDGVLFGRRASVSCHQHTLCYVIPSTHKGWDGTSVVR